MGNIENVRVVKLKTLAVRIGGNNKMKEDYRDYSFSKLTKEEFMNLRDRDILIYGKSIIRIGEDFFQLVCPIDLTVVTDVSK